MESIDGVVVNSRLINAFREKNWLLKSKVEQMSYFAGIEFDIWSSASWAIDSEPIRARGITIVKLSKKA